MRILQQFFLKSSFASKGATCLIALLWIAADACASTAYRSDRRLALFDIDNPSQLRGHFEPGTVFSIIGPTNAHNMVYVEYAPTTNMVIRGLCKLSELRWITPLTSSDNRNVCWTTMEMVVPKAHPLIFHKLPNGLWVSRYKVTHEQWASVTGVERQAYANTTNSPVCGISMREAQIFCDILSAQPNIARIIPKGYQLRLPTSEERDYYLDYYPINKTQGSTTNIMVDKTHYHGHGLSNVFGLCDIWVGTSEWVFNEHTRIKISPSESGFRCVLGLPIDKRSQY